MNDWLTTVSAASGIPSEIFILGFIAFFLLIVLVIGLIYCLIRLKSISANTLQTVAQARMAWREDLGAAVTQSKDLIADRMKPNFMETERTLERSFQDVSAGIRSETFASLKAVQDTLNQSLSVFESSSKRSFRLLICSSFRISDWFNVLWTTFPLSAISSRILLDNSSKRLFTELICSSLRVRDWLSVSCT